MGPSGALIAAASAVKPISGGMKPMITLPGFITITTVEFLYDPSAGWNHMQLVLNQYGIWKELGRLPREMFPELAPPELVEKVKRITAMSQRKAAELIEAKRVELAIKAQGQQNAIDLLDDRRWVYGYR
jgi:predicted oxidoreductase